MNLQTKELMAVKRVVRFRCLLIIHVTQSVPSQATERARVLEQIRTEWRVITELQCPNLVQYYGIEFHKVRL